MADRDIIVIGTSAGGVDVLVRLARDLPKGFPASLFVVCHFPPGGKSVLPEILSRAGPLLAAHPADGDPFYPGQIYVAPPDRHLVLEPGGRIAADPRAAGEPPPAGRRPAVPVGRPALRAAGDRRGPDRGAVRRGGRAAGRPRGRRAGRRPGRARRRGGGHAPERHPDRRGRPDRPGRRPGGHSGRPGPTHPRRPAREGPAVDPMDQMPEVVREDMDEQIRNERVGQVSVFTCPECGGSLWQVGSRG